MWFKASAPASLMLLGEYNVLYGGLALVASIDKRMAVYLSPRTDKKISIISRLGKHSCDIANIIVVSPFEYILTAISHFQPLLKTGCDITIESEISSELGFGSSAAVTAATVSVLGQWLKKNFDTMQLIIEARSVVQKVQGSGSGADIAACVLGGMVAYRREPLYAERIADTFPITVIYSGSKTKTSEAIKRITANFAGKPEEFEKICQGIGTCAELGIEYAKEKKWRELGEVMNAQQHLMEQLGVSTSQLEEILENLHQQPDILGAKISGSGWGDCAIGLGTVSEAMKFRDKKIQVLSAAITTEGLSNE